MSVRDYKRSMKLEHETPEALIMALIRKGDMAYADPVKKAFPSVLEELQARFRAPGGILPEDK